MTQISKTSLLTLTIAVSSTLWLAACFDPSDTKETQTQASDDTTTAEASQSKDSAVGSILNVDLIADFRGAPTKSIVPQDEQRRISIIESVFGSGAPADVWIAGSVEGSFTKANASQTLYLFTRGKPEASYPGTKPPMLVVFEDGKPVAQFLLTDMSYQEITAVGDTDFDGVDEVLMTAHAYQMGQRTSSSQLYGVKGGQRTLIETFERVYENNCDAPFSDNQVRAAVLVVATKDTGSQGRLKRIDYVAPCQPGNDAPPLNAYK